MNIPSPPPGTLGVILAVIAILLAVVLGFIGLLPWKLVALFVLVAAARLC